MTLSARWQGEDGYAHFLSDVGRRPSAQHSLDRKKNERGYEPENVRWATRQEQMRNTRRNRRITIEGRTLTLVEWAETSGVPYKVVHNRLNKLGWAARRAIFGKWEPR